MSGAFLIGRRSDGRDAPLSVSDDGKLKVDIGGASVTIEGDVTLANEVEVKNDQGNPVPASVASIGATNDAAASTDDGTFSLLALFKRSLQRLTAIIGYIDGLEGSATSIDGKLPALSSGAVPVLGSVSARTPATTSVASSATSVTVVATNSSRKGLSVSNISTAKLYLSFSSPATTANCFIEIPAGAFLLLDQQMIVGNAIYGIWSAANGAAQVTEYV